MTAQDLPEPIAAFKRAVVRTPDPQTDFLLARVVRQDPERCARLNRLTEGDMVRVWKGLERAPLHPHYRTNSDTLRSDLMVRLLMLALCPPVPTEKPVSDQNKRLKKIAKAARALYTLLMEQDSISAFHVTESRPITVEITRLSATQVLPGLDAALRALPQDAPPRKGLLELQKEALLSHSSPPTGASPYPDLISAEMIFAPLFERLIPLADLADKAQETPRPKPPHRGSSAPATALVRDLADFFGQHYAKIHYTAIASMVNAALNLQPDDLWDGRKVFKYLKNQ